MHIQVKGPKELFRDVIDRGLCILCGACAGGCPYLVSYKGRIVLLDNCTLSEGQCYKYCPRAYTDMDAISQHIFGVPYSEDELGTTREVLMARSTDVNIKRRAQYGGTATVLLSLALAEGFIDSAILTKTSDEKTPIPFIADSAEEVLQGTGSNYMACPILETYNHLPKESNHKLGIVAMPCQALALAKMKTEPPENRVSVGNVKLVIGLFCTWALSPDKFYKFLNENVDLLQVEKFDIPPPPANRFDVYTKSGTLSFPLEQIRKFVMPGCAYCLDMTSEFADISVGSVEGIEGWNTVIVRTEAGAKLMEMAKARKVLETAALPPQNLAHLKEASLLKKKRALKEIVNRTGNKQDLLYIGLSQTLVDKLLA
jgi:coenzyme F420 hydrogenase subunit beta